jgi:hypothetical protein
MEIRSLDAPQVGVEGKQPGNRLQYRRFTGAIGPNQKGYRFEIDGYAVTSK